MNHLVILILVVNFIVVRGYQSGSSGDFLGDNANQSQSLATGQVLHQQVNWNWLYKIKL